MPPPAPASHRLPQAPAPVASLSPLPHALLPEIAAAAAAPLAALSTLTVPSHALPLYPVVLHYAALAAPRAALHVHTCAPQPTAPHTPAPTPQAPQAPDGPPVPPVPPAPPPQPSPHGGVHPALYLARDAPAPARLPAAHPAPPEPFVTLGAGRAVVPWPPPPHLAAPALRAPGARQFADDAPAPAGGARGARAESAPATDIHVVHYSVGPPRAVGDRLEAFREVLLVSAHGPDALRAFVTEVLRWRAEVEFVPPAPRVGAFELLRFHGSHGCGYWMSEGLKKGRPPASVILAPGQMDAILADVHGFLSKDTRRWYRDHGLPQRRSYLFYGVPGSGKTSTIRAIASTFGLLCCFLSMTGPNFCNQLLGDALSQMPSPALLVLEDVDALFDEDRKAKVGESKLTFSGMLNALDGLVSKEGVITVMTTNHFERLDSALVRGGRVDRRFRFGKASDEQIKALFRSFYPDTSGDVVDKFAVAIGARKEGDEARSISTIQELFIKHRESSAEECIQGVQTFYKEHFPSTSV